MIFSLLLAHLSFGNPCFAVTPNDPPKSAQAPKKKKTNPSDLPPSVSLMERAKAELKPTEGEVEKSTATDNQVSGILILKDPLPPEAKSPVRVQVGLKISQWTPKGQVNVSGTDYDLGSQQSTYIPKLELALGSRDFSAGRLRMSLAARVEGGYLSQKSQFVFNSGNVPRSTYLNSVEYGYGIDWVVGLDSVKNWDLDFFPHVENYQYNQSSGTSDAEFSLSGSEQVLSFGPQYHWNENLILFLQWSPTVARTQSQLPQREARTEMGLRVQW